MKAEVQRVGTLIPYIPNDGKYSDLGKPAGLYFWTNGFWSGILWQMYNATDDEVYRTAAEGGQGYGQNSSWSRGQGWAVYGFSLSYHHTGDESFLTTAKQFAHYCISNLAVNECLPLSDYRTPAEPVKYDTTAGMLTAAGLLELADHVGEYEKKLYAQSAVNILKACEKRFCNWNPDEDSIVDGGTLCYHDSGAETHKPIIYGDYYFIEAILKLKGKSMFIW